MKSDADITHTLQAWLARIDAERASSAGEREPVMLDQSRVGRLARMDAMQVQAMAQAQDRRRRLQRRRIEGALNRLANGTWGICSECGDAIAPGRLEFDPTVGTCFQCASARD